MILVTGGNGFQGIPLCEHLAANGHQVLSVARHPVQSDQYQSAKGDVTDKMRMAELFRQYPIQAVVHLVSLLVTRSNHNPDQAVGVNVIGTLNMLELCKEFGVKRFVYGSSYNAIGYYPYDMGAVDETVEPLPNSFYGETKRFNEKMGIQYAAVNGLEFVSARLSVLLGPGEPSPTSAWRMDIYNLLHSGGEVQISFAADQYVPLADINETAAGLAILALAEHPKHSIYNIPSETMRMSELAKLVEDIGNDLHVTCGDKKVNDMPPLVSSERIQKEFDYTPVPLTEHLKAYREELRKCL